MWRCTCQLPPMYRKQNNRSRQSLTPICWCGKMCVMEITATRCDSVETQLQCIQGAQNIYNVPTGKRIKPYFNIPLSTLQRTINVPLKPAGDFLLNLPADYQCCPGVRILLGTRSYNKTLLMIWELFFGTTVTRVCEDITLYTSVCDDYTLLLDTIIPA